MGMESHKWVIHPGTLKKLKEMIVKQKECINNCYAGKDYFIGLYNGMETYLSILEERKPNLIPVEKHLHAETNISDFTKGDIISAENYMKEYLHLQEKHLQNHTVKAL